MFSGVLEMPLQFIFIKKTLLLPFPAAGYY